MRILIQKLQISSASNLGLLLKAIENSALFVRAGDSVELVKGKDMNSNDFEYNYFEYPEDSVYITLGINAGLATKIFLVNEEEIFLNNLAFCNIWTNYLRNVYKTEFTSEVNRTITTVSYKGKKDSMGDDIIYLLNSIFKTRLESEIFEIVKRETIEGFKQKYKKGLFRGVYKSFEVADTNKKFLLRQLIEDLQKITFDDFIKCFQKLIIPNNSYIYINGNLRDLTNQEIQLINEVINEASNEAALGGEILDPYLRGDAHILELSREEANIDIIYFAFQEQVAMMNRLIYLDIEMNKIPFGEKMLHIDEFDASLIVSETKLTKLKKYYKRISSEEQFEKAKRYILLKYRYWLEKKPEQFGVESVKLRAIGVSIAEYLDILKRVTYEMYFEIANQVKPIISEAQVVMRR